MKKLIACAVASLVATSALAGDKSVIYILTSVTTPVYNTLYMAEGVTPLTSQTVSAAVSTSQPQGIAGQPANSQTSENAVYANLLKEAKKRGLR